MKILPNVSVIRGVVWYVVPTLGFGRCPGFPFWQVPAYITIKVLWFNRGLAFDWRTDE